MKRVADVAERRPRSSNQGSAAPGSSTMDPSTTGSSTTGATPPNTQRIHVVDSHTAGEPTRVVLDGGPDLGTGPLSERLQRLRSEHDGFRSAVVNEPRGSDVLIGALLTKPVAPDATIGVIFFNNVGYLGMCGHGTIGVVETLRHLGRIGPGRHRIETPVGTVVAALLEDGRVSLENVPAYRHRAAVTVQVPEHGNVTGDVAYGGNWFFLIGSPLASHTLGSGSSPGVATPPPVDMDHIEELTAFTWAVRDALQAAGVTGADGAEIDHIELYAHSETADSRNFVLCPGKAYDRSPCGTGTSAKLACLHADGVLEAGVVWRQESVIGSSFDASYVLDAEGQVRPTIVGRAHVTAEATLVLAADDPFRWGIR